jgi:hypothetical protein
MMAIIRISTEKVKIPLKMLAMPRAKQRIMARMPSLEEQPS